MFFNFVFIYPTPLHKQDEIQGIFFKQFYRFDLTISLLLYLLP